MSEQPTYLCHEIIRFAIRVAPFIHFFLGGGGGGKNVPAPLERLCLGRVHIYVTKG